MVANLEFENEVNVSRLGSGSWPAVPSCAVWTAARTAPHVGRDLRLVSKLLPLVVHGPHRGLLKFTIFAFCHKYSYMPVFIKVRAAPYK